MTKRTGFDPLAATQLPETTGGIAPHELAGLAETARRGDVFPVCLRLDAARAASAWAERASIALAVGPVCPGNVLDTACTFMPRATGPRLLRAGAAIARATHAPNAAERASWVAHAGRDLEDAARLDPADVTVLVLRSELATIARRPSPSR